MKTKFYKDFNQFSPNKYPYIYNENAIYQSIINIISVMRGEVLFRPDDGLNLEELLFELDTDLEDSTAFLALLAAEIESRDKRISVNQNSSSVITDSDNNQLKLFLTFNVAGFDGQTFSIEESIQL